MDCARHARQDGDPAVRLQSGKPRGAYLPQPSNTVEAKARDDALMNIAAAIRAAVALGYTQRVSLASSCRGPTRFRFG
jgi:hypothetical protein